MPSPRSSPFFLGLELQPADGDPQGPGEQQEHAGAEPEPQRHRLHPQPAVHQPDRPAVPGPERQQAGQPAAPDEAPGAPADAHPEQQPADARPVAVSRGVPVAMHIIDSLNNLLLIDLFDGFIEKMLFLFLRNQVSQ